METKVASTITHQFFFRVLLGCKIIDIVHSLVEKSLVALIWHEMIVCWPTELIGADAMAVKIQYSFLKPDLSFHVDIERWSGRVTTIGLIQG